MNDAFSKTTTVWALKGDPDCLEVAYTFIADKIERGEVIEGEWKEFLILHLRSMSRKKNGSAGRKPLSIQKMLDVFQEMEKLMDEGLNKTQASKKIKKDGVHATEHRQILNIYNTMCHFGWRSKH